MKPCRLFFSAAALASLLITSGNLLVAADSPAPRTWTDSTGKHRVEATLLAKAGDSVQLKREDGQQISVPLTRLSQADRQFVASWKPASPTLAAMQQFAAKVPVAVGPAARSLERAIADTLGNNQREPAVDVVLVRVSRPWLQQRFARSVDQSRTVSDRILGHPISGQARTVGHTQLSLVPDADRVRIDLWFTGVVYSNTTAYDRRASVRSAGVTQFSARKPLMLTDAGLTYGPAQVSAQTSSHTTGISTQGGLFSRITSRVATRRAAEQRPLANAEAARKAEVRIAQSFDAQVNSEMARLQQSYQNDLLAFLKHPASPLREIDFRTTAQHVEITLHGEGVKVDRNSLPPIESEKFAAVYIHGSLARRLLNDTKLAPLLKSLEQRLEAAGPDRLVSHEATKPDFDIRWTGDKKWLALSWSTATPSKPKSASELPPLVAGAR